ncbi:cation-translocating P-type ATPase [Rhizobium sp. PL01]|uniref:cation-translocating P-type ATPase n=1 Tax=Rhizobium sp. PL01 TaxID=3085631 RepID=UPI00298196D6|nr:cation-translocating P-type ATPase [Rhizobium sp. PL01]MDW5317490.1 cation-translocating P-type ATPase [Rhizobium sp. PL01]
MIPNSTIGTEAENWYEKSSNEVLDVFDSSSSGLSSAEAAARLVADGPNQIKQAKRPGVARILLSQFRSLIIWILIVAGAVSGIMGEMANAIAILVIVVLNAFMGFYQELSAERSVDALRLLTAPEVKLRRDGRVLSFPAVQVVKGDILMLEAGDLVAADSRILQAASLSIMEATLTGESETVEKQAAAFLPGKIPIGDQSNMVFMGTSVAAGTGEAVVVATAMDTQLGRIASLLDQAQSEKRTPLQQKLDAFGRLLIWIALGIVAVLFGLGYLRGTPLGELSLTAIGLAVAAVPEGLPAIVTVALSVGVLQMARRRVLVRKLATVETLGSTTVICTDKTGTLTVGQMTVRALYVAGISYDVTGEGYGPDGQILFADKIAAGDHLPRLLALASVQIGCNNAHLFEEEGIWRVIGDPTEGALLVSGGKAGANRVHMDEESPVIIELPFDSDRKRSSVVRKMPNGRLGAYVNGAPGPLLARCSHIYTQRGVVPLLSEDRRAILSVISGMAKRSLRVLGSAQRDFDLVLNTDICADEVECNLTFVGLAGMFDPPRSEAKGAIANCHAAGIRVVMITGDHPETASAIATDLGIASGALATTGTDLEATSESDLRERAPLISVYARVTAEHKLRIVRALQANGDVVAMTGDGVNDAPAIKGADIGIAMGQTGTQVTKQSADLIVTDDNFATIVEAVEQGRGIYDSIRKTLQYLLAGSTAELLLMTVCVIIGLPAPLLPIHLLWINLVTDGLPALCLATDRIDPSVMNRPPRRRSESMTDRRFLSTMLLTGLLTASVAFGVYFYTLTTKDAETARTYAFTVMVFSEILRAFGARSETESVWRISLLTNRSLLAVVVGTFAVQIWSQHNAVLGGLLKTSPIAFPDFLVLFMFAAIPLFVLELFKLVRPVSVQN